MGQTVRGNHISEILGSLILRVPASSESLVSPARTTPHPNSEKLRRGYKRLIRGGGESCELWSSRGGASHCNIACGAHVDRSRLPVKPPGIHLWYVVLHTHFHNKEFDTSFFLLTPRAAKWLRAWYLRSQTLFRTSSNNHHLSPSGDVKSKLQA